MEAECGDVGWLVSPSMFCACPSALLALPLRPPRGPGCSPVGTGGFKLLGPFFFRPNFQNTSSQKLVRGGCRGDGSIRML